MCKVQSPSTDTTAPLYDNTTQARPITMCNICLVILPQRTCPPDSPPSSPSHLVLRTPSPTSGESQIPVLLSSLHKFSCLKPVFRCVRSRVAAVHVNSCKTMRTAIHVSRNALTQPSVHKEQRAAKSLVCSTVIVEAWVY